MTRWRRWWRFANVEQFWTFGVVSIVTITLTSMLAHSTLYGEQGLPNNVNFLRTEGERLQAIVGPWFGVLFWATGAFSLFGSAMGITDYTSRMAADVLKSTYLRDSPVTESRLYFWLVWGLVGIGCGIILIGMNQPMVLLVISACVGGTMMFMYSGLLIQLNRTHLPAPIRIRAGRFGVLLWAMVFFGFLAGMTVWQQTTAVPMKALLLAEYGRFELADMAVPDVGAEDVLVRVRACGICGSDIHGYTGITGRRIPPLVMGHEAAGVIERVGAAVEGFCRRRSRDLRFDGVLRPLRVLPPRRGQPLRRADGARRLVRRLPAARRVRRVRRGARRAFFIACPTRCRSSTRRWSRRSPSRCTPSGGECPRLTIGSP